MRINDWINDDKREFGASRLNLDYLRKLKTEDEKFARLGIVNWFMLNRLDMNDYYTIKHSVKSQRKLIWAVIAETKEYRIRKQDEKLFKAFLSSLYRRRKHLDLIMHEQIRLSKYYPFFEATGYEQIDEFEIPTEFEPNSTQLEWLFEAATKWNAEHEQEVKAHMESVRDEIEARDRHQAEIKEKEKAEKKAAREAKKAENAEIRQWKKYEEDRRKRQRRIDREMGIV